MDKIPLSNDYILACFLAKLLGNPAENIYDIFKVKDHPIKVNNDITVEDFKKCCIQYNEQRRESFFKIIELCIFEQQVFLTRGYIDRNLRKRFKGVELSDTPTVKAIVEEARYQYSRVDISEYDEQIVYDYMWTVSVTHPKSTCLVGSAKDVVNYALHCDDVNPNPRIVQSKDLWENFNWKVNSGEIVAFI